MARKIFVSYKHSDSNVQRIEDVGEYNPFKVTTARDYVEELIELFEDDEIYKGEGNEDLSEFKVETIQTHLKNKIYDSTVTVVLISPNMKESWKSEDDQWIPWEISYSLKEITRNNRTSRSNGMLAVVLPDIQGSYEYYLVTNCCPKCNYVYYKTNTLFQILRKNMFNVKNPVYSNCDQHNPYTVYTGEFSYIPSVTWENFKNGKDIHLDRVENIRDNIDNYEIVKTVKDEYS